MSDIRKSLESLADSIEKIQNQPPPKVKVLDRELSGNKIKGGVITQFSSTGVKDEAANTVLTIKNDGVHVDTVHAKEFANSAVVRGNLDVKGEVTAQKLHVNEITSDIRHERSSPLEFRGNEQSAYGQGLIWSGGSYTKQFVLRSEPDRLWSSESIDIHRNQSYYINGVSVLSDDALGQSITKSNLKKVGKLQSLEVTGDFVLDEFVRYNSSTEQFSIGASDPNGMFSIESFDHQFIIDPTDDKNFKIGTWTTSGVDLVTDDTTRLHIENTGKVSFYSYVAFNHPIGIGVKNPETDVDLTVSGAVRFQNKKQEVAPSSPKNGVYNQGDIAWNDNPQPTGYVGWICVKSGSPGDWKPFGQIAG